MLEMMENRVQRPFCGGKLLDEFMGLYPGVDGNYPERWICSATRSVDGKGISQTKEGIPLTSVYKEPVNILVKLLDSRSRLMIQVHPDDERAEKYFSSRFGKAECWYILDTRTIDGQEPYVYLGFKEHVTREHWEALYQAQDIAGMEACLHKIPVKKGDAFFIPGGLVHAMGSGVFFAEIQQPTDITLRVERVSPDGRMMDDKGLHGGAGEKALFDCFDYHGCSREEILSRYKLRLREDTVVDNALFWMRDIRVSQSCLVRVDPYAIVLVLEGEDKGKEFFLTEDTLFSGACRLLICGSRC
ncbi:MAG: class I mannose-6-phosphate isomerase [Oscillospiraceae bacterium]|nr:class I mannose-6-phosphate isomerase [Oscillospiraceae bacterium]